MLSTSDKLLLEKILHLGKRLERSRINELLDPWDFNGYDSIEVQNAGKKISNFVGLPNLTFIISYNKQDSKTAGHIELNSNSDEGVFIELDEKYKSESDIILAILAHEICHKLIHINGLSQFGYENEILTDVATVYTGLGKLSLNGCETKKVSSKTKWNGNEQNITTTTTTQSVGYLKRAQFAFLYKVICHMRKIPNEIAIQGLNDDALIEINNTRYYHNEELFQNDYATDKVNETLNKFIHQYHLISAKNVKLIKALQNNLESVNSINNTIHKQIKSTNEKYLVKASENLNPARLNYIKNLLLINELASMTGLFNDEVEEFSLLNTKIIDFINVIDGQFQFDPRDRELFYSINCPTCGNVMRLKQDKLVKIRCTVCKYSFIVDNSITENQFHIRKEKEVKKSLIRKLKEIMAIIKE